MSTNVLLCTYVCVSVDKCQNVMCTQYVVKHNLVLDGKLCLTTYCVHITF